MIELDEVSWTAGCAICGWQVDGDADSADEARKLAKAAVEKHVTWIHPGRDHLRSHEAWYPQGKAES